jgi:hypothetical protein
MSQLRFPRIFLTADVSPERLGDMTNELSQDLKKAGLAPASDHEEAASGHRGDPITLGTIVLTSLSSGTVVALLQCLQAGFVKNRKLHVRISSSRDHYIEIDASNVSSIEVERFVKSLAPSA